jgi:hypothetical protein
MMWLRRISRVRGLMPSCWGDGLTFEACRQQFQHFPFPQAQAGVTLLSFPGLVLGGSRRRSAADQNALHQQG